MAGVLCVPSVRDLNQKRAHTSKEEDDEREDECDGNGEVCAPVRTEGLYSKENE